MGKPFYITDEGEIPSRAKADCMIRPFNPKKTKVEIQQARKTKSIMRASVIGEEDTHAGIEKRRDRETDSIQLWSIKTDPLFVDIRLLSPRPRSYIDGSFI